MYPRKAISVGVTEGSEYVPLSYLITVTVPTMPVLFFHPHRFYQLRESFRHYDLDIERAALTNCLSHQRVKKKIECICI